MAKKRGRKSGSNKSQLIRDTYESLGKGARPRDVLHALNKQGVDVSRALVTNVLKRHGAAPAAGRRGPGRPRKNAAAAKPASSGDAVTMASVMAAKRMVGEVGSIDQARAALETLAKAQLS